MSTKHPRDAEDMKEVIRLARENGINVNITRYDLAQVNEELARPRPQNPRKGRADPPTVGIKSTSGQSPV